MPFTTLKSHGMRICDCRVALNSNTGLRISGGIVGIRHKGYCLRWMPYNISAKHETIEIMTLKVIQGRKSDENCTVLFRS